MRLPGATQTLPLLRSGASRKHQGQIMGNPIEFWGITDQPDMNMMGLNMGKWQSQFSGEATYKIHCIRYEFG
jgi:hypothetical protein